MKDNLNLRSSPYNNANINFFSLYWIGQLERFLLFMLLLSLTRISRAKAAQPYDSSTICNDTLLIDDNIQIPITCDKETKESYLDSPISYQEDKERVGYFLSNMTQNPYVHCKLATVAEDSRFNIAFNNSALDNLNAIGAYMSDTGALLLRSQAPSEKMFSVEHELHHAYITRRNYKLNINHIVKKSDGSLGILPPHTGEKRFETEARVLQQFGKRATFFESSYPHKTFNHLQELYNTFSQIEQRIEYFILLLDLMNVDEMQKLRLTSKPLSLLTSEEKLLANNTEKLNDLLELTRHYQPRAHSAAATPQKIAALIRDGGMNKHYQMLTTYKGYKYGVPLYVQHTYGNATAGTLEFCSYTVPTLSPEDRRNAALLDGYLILKTLLNNRGYSDDGTYRKNLITEADAHFHELYEPHPELFEFLFPELFYYHQTMNEPILNKCLMELTIKSANFNQDSLENFRIQLIKNTKKLKRNPEDPWALYYVSDTYKQLALSHYQLKNFKIAVLSLSQAFQHCINYLKVADISPVEVLYFQVLDDYLAYLQANGQYKKAQVVSKIAWAVLPANYQPTFSSTWSVHCMEGISYLGKKQYSEAEKYFKKSQEQLKALFDEKSIKYNLVAVNSIKAYQQTRVKDLYRYLEETQQQLGKYESAKNTQQEKRIFLQNLQSNNENSVELEEQHSTRIEF